MVAARVIDLADDDPSEGNFIMGSPLALALTTRAMPGIAWVVPDGQTTCATAWPWPAAPTRCPTPWLSRMSTSREYRWACWLPDDRAVLKIEDALRIAERSSDDMALVFARASRALRWCTATRMRSAIADRSCWRKSAT